MTETRSPASSRSRSRSLPGLERPAGGVAHRHGESEEKGAAPPPLHRRPGLKVVPLRGNVEARIRKARQGSMAGIILAQAGLRRLVREELITHSLPCEWLVPSVGQGALAVTARSDRAEILSLASHSRASPQPRPHYRGAGFPGRAARRMPGLSRGAGRGPGVAGIPRGLCGSSASSPPSTERGASAVCCPGPASGRRRSAGNWRRTLLGRGGREVLEDVRGGEGSGGPRA